MIVRIQCLSSQGNKHLCFHAVSWRLMRGIRGPTRKETRLSEAQSYAAIAAENEHWGFLPNPASAEVLLEERALDSYHNVLFSLTRFYSQFQTWPSHISIISHGFKRERLVDGHCTAIGFPIERVTFVGIDPPAMAAGDKQEAMKGVGLAMGEWRNDPHGRGESLAGKRARRNPWVVEQTVFAQKCEDRGGLGLKVLGGVEVLDEDEPKPW